MKAIIQFTMNSLLFIAVIISLSSMIVPACSQELPSSISGQLLFFGKTIDEFDFDSNQYYTVKDFDGLGGQKFLTVGPYDSVLILMEYPGQEATFHRSVFTQSMRSIDGEWQVKFPYPIYKCYNLNYDSSSGHYLFSGQIRDRFGIFELDKDLEVIRRRAIPEDCGESAHFVANHIRGDSLLVQCGSSILIGDWDSGSLEFLSEGLILDVAPNRDYVLLSSSGDDPNTLSELDCASKKVKRLPIDCFAILHASYSPDNRYIAYNERLNSLVFQIKVGIYDRLEEKTWKTKMHNDASFVWLSSK